MGNSAGTGNDSVAEIDLFQNFTMHTLVGLAFKGTSAQRSNRFTKTGADFTTDIVIVYLNETLVLIDAGLRIYVLGTTYILWQQPS